MKNGFTLVELLAVIAILGIIMAITFLSVNIILKNSRESLSETQIANVEEAAKVYYLKEGMAISAECVSVSELINNGYIDANEVKDPKTKSTMNGYVKITYESNQYNYDYSTESCYTIYENGTPVYFNVTSGKVCQKDEAISTTGTKSGCMKFYAFNDDGGATINLILDHNTSNIASTKNPRTQLKTDTENWKGTQVPTNFTCIDTTKGSAYCRSVDYSSYRARLISAREIAQMIGVNDWDEQAACCPSINIMYFDTGTSSASETCTSGNTSDCKYGWLYDRISGDCIDYGCLNADEKGEVYYVDSNANSPQNYYYVDYGSIHLGAHWPYYEFGVRPVITVLKDKLK